MILCRGILLTILCTSVALAACPLARAQDATSATLQDLPKKLAATPTPHPKKSTPEPTLEISTGTPTGTPNPKPAPAAEQTPTVEEMPTPAQEPEKKIGEKRHATSGAVVDLMSLSAAKAVAVRAPLPEYPYQAKRAHITGSGVCVMKIDTASGSVTSAIMAESTGDDILDKVTIKTFQRWRFKPGTVSQVRVPISYE
jgi:protein TonB